MPHSYKATNKNVIEINETRYDERIHTEAKGYGRTDASAVLGACDSRQ